jgi:hypothetical protein
MDFVMYWTSPEGMSVFTKNRLDPNNLQSAGIAGPPIVKGVELPADVTAKLQRLKFIGNYEKPGNPGDAVARGFFKHQPSLRDWVDLFQCRVQRVGPMSAASRPRNPRPSPIGTGDEFDSPTPNGTGYGFDPSAEPPVHVDASVCLSHGQPSGTPPNRPPLAAEASPCHPERSEGSARGRRGPPERRLAGWLAVQKG